MNSKKKSSTKAKKASAVVQKRESIPNITSSNADDEKKLQRRQSKMLGKTKSKYNMLKLIEMEKLNQELENKQEKVLENPTKKSGRTIIAEDFNYNLPKVKTLTDLCLEHMVNKFIVHRFTMKRLSEKFQKKIISQLSVDLPLWTTADVIDDEDYWKKKCRSRWKTSDYKDHRNSWKITYMEMNIEDAIEQFVPAVSDVNELLGIVDISSQYVKTLDIKQLQTKQMKTTSKLTDANSQQPSVKMDNNINVDDGGNGSDITTKILQALQLKKPQLIQEDSDEDYERFDFTDVLPKLRCLEELSLQYILKKCGMDFKWGFFKMLEKDCVLLAKSLYFCKTLKRLSIINSRMDDTNIKTLCSQLKDHPSLTSLNLSHNTITDKGMVVISTTLLIQNAFINLQSLDMTNNNIRSTGAKALAKELETNVKLVTLQLRMNKLDDEAGSMIMIALTSNTTLKVLGLSSCDLGDKTAEALCYMLKINSTLESLDLSCNFLGTDNGDMIQEAMESNETLVKMDLRETEVTKEAEYFIDVKCQSNEENNIK